MIFLPVITCDGCGGCCDEQGTPPMLMDEYDALPGDLKWNRAEHAKRYDRSLPCLWFNTETRRCNHYDHRPDACRTAVITGDECCLEFRKERGI